jgi:hypothetical protein
MRQRKKLLTKLPNTVVKEPGSGTHAAHFEKSHSLSFQA